MARATPMVALGYGKFVRADRVYALVPLEGDDRGDGRRTLVHVEGIEEPLIASRSEVAIAQDVAVALGQTPPAGRHETASPVRSRCSSDAGVAARRVHVAMLRGINIGPNRRVPMADLRTLLTEAGYEDVRTYVQSGNIVLASPRQAGRRWSASCRR